MAGEACGDPNLTEENGRRRCVTSYGKRETMLPYTLTHRENDVRVSSPIPIPIPILGYL
jgi:hypothetical protein